MNTSKIYTVVKSEKERRELLDMMEGVDSFLDEHLDSNHSARDTLAQRISEEVRQEIRTITAYQEKL